MAIELLREEEFALDGVAALLDLFVLLSVLRRVDKIFSSSMKSSGRKDLVCGVSSSLSFTALLFDLVARLLSGFNSAAV